MKRQLLNDIQNFDLGAVECRTNFDKESLGSPFNLELLQNASLSYFSACFLPTDAPLPKGGPQPSIAALTALSGAGSCPTTFCTLVLDLSANGCVRVAMSYGDALYKVTHRDCRESTNFAFS